MAPEYQTAENVAPSPVSASAEAIPENLPILSAQHFDSFDRCERRYALEQKWQPRVLQPMGLLYRAVETALQADPQTDAEQVAKDTALGAITKYELPTVHLDAYSTAVHLGYLAGIVACALRARIGQLHRPEPVEYLDSEWRSALLEDSRNELHRIVLVSHWDDDRLTAEAHSWATIGELAAMGRPLTLQIVIVGASRLGRRHSAWTRGFLHPQSHGLRFRKRGSTGERDPEVNAASFSGDWQRVWREQAPQIATRNWLQIMKSDGVLEELILTRHVALREDDPRMKAARREMWQLTKGMERASTKAPMRRSSCDEIARGPCPFGSLCYSPIEVRPEDLPHLYQIR